MSKFCIKCGAEMPEESKFCPKCGNEVGKPNSSSKKKILPFIIGGGIIVAILVLVIILVITLGGGSSESSTSGNSSKRDANKNSSESVKKDDDLDNVTNENDSESITEENNANSEFEKAIYNFEKAKSLNFIYEKYTRDLGSDYEAESRYNIIIDYKTQKVKQVQTYSKNLFGDSSVEETSYVDLELKREYFYGKDSGYSCDKWWYETFGDDEFSKVYDVLDSIKYLTDEDIAKIVGTNYRVYMKDSKYGIADIGVENGKITYIIYSYSSGIISNSIDITVNSYNSDNISLPSDVKNALSSIEFNRVCDE